MRLKYKQAFFFLIFQKEKRKMWGFEITKKSKQRIYNDKQLKQKKETIKRERERERRTCDKSGANFRAKFNTSLVT
jgi:hypothetical protein